MREAVLRPGARDYYDLMSDVEQADVDRRLRWLERHSTPDSVSTVAVPGLPTFGIFDDGVWQIVYETPEAATLAVHSIAHALDLHRS